MLFHITHTHTPEACLYREPETLASTFGRIEESMIAAGAKVIGLWVDVAAHTFFFVIDADSAAQITAGLDPVVDRGDSAIRPIAEVAATIQSLQKKG